MAKVIPENRTLPLRGFVLSLLTLNWIVSAITALNFLSAYKNFPSWFGPLFFAAIGSLICIISCKTFSKGDNGWNSRPFSETTVYEINIVLKNSEAEPKRINISARENERRIRDDASQFADFLGVPLLDHT